MKKVYSKASITAVSYRKVSKTINGQPKNYYQYPTTLGDYCFRISVGEDEISQEYISRLYDMDNAEVDRNCRKDKPERSETEKEQLRKYQESHYDNVGENWTDSLERIEEEAFEEGTDIDQFGFMYANWQEANPGESDRVSRLREIITILTPEEQSLLYMKYYEGMSFSEIGAVYGIHKMSVKGRLDTLLRKMKKLF